MSNENQVWAAHATLAKNDQPYDDPRATGRAAGRAPSVHEQAGCLEKEVVMLSEVVEALDAKTRPVRFDLPPTPAPANRDASPTAPLCPVASNLREKVEQIAFLRQRLNYVLSTLEV